MFDIGASELLVIAIIAIIVIGPKELPLALRTAGRWIGKIRRVSSHFRTGLDAMIREAEMEDMDRKWKEQNDAIMAKYPASDDSDPQLVSEDAPKDQMAPIDTPDKKCAKAEAAQPAAPDQPSVDSPTDEQPPLPLDPPNKAS